MSFNSYTAQMVRDSAGRRPVTEGLFHTGLHVEKAGVVKYGIWNVFVPMNIECSLGDLIRNEKFNLLAHHLINVRGVGVDTKVRAGTSIKGIRCIIVKRREYRSKGTMIFDRTAVEESLL